MGRCFGDSRVGSDYGIEKVGRCDLAEVGKGKVVCVVSDKKGDSI
jgi:hypothetical protein